MDSDTDRQAADRQAADRLVSGLYDELRALAGTYLRGERPGHTLQPTALVHEAYLRLAAADPDRLDRVAFLAAAAHVMRQVLIDHARKRRRQKRGGGAERVPLDDLLIAMDDRAVDVLALDDALDRLKELDERKSRIVELRFFGGLTIPETASALGISHATVEREWKFVRAWLHREITVGDDPHRSKE